MDNHEISLHTQTRFFSNQPSGSLPSKSQTATLICKGGLFINMLIFLPFNSDLISRNCQKLHSFMIRLCDKIMFFFFQNYRQHIFHQCINRHNITVKFKSEVKYCVISFQRRFDELRMIDVECSYASSSCSNSFISKTTG